MNVHILSVDEMPKHPIVFSEQTDDMHTMNVSEMPMHPIIYQKPANERHNSGSDGFAEWARGQGTPIEG